MEADVPFPLDFSFRNLNEQHVLFTQVPSQKMVLEIINKSESVLKFLAPKSGQAKCLELKFRPGILSRPDKIVLGEGAGDWGLTIDGSTLKLLPSKDIEIDPGKSIFFNLNDVAADGRGGSRGTRVELIHSVSKYSSNDEKWSECPGQRTHYLSVMDEIQTLPQTTQLLSAHLVGSSTILNDKSENLINLRLTNTSFFDLEITNSTNVEICFEGCDSEKEKPWALARLTAGDNISIEETKQVSSKVEWTPEVNNEQGRQKALYMFKPKIPPKQIRFIEAGKWIDFLIRIHSTATDGTGYVRVCYQGFSHYSGTIYVPVEKRKILQIKEKVGIGTASPTAALEVNGDTFVKETLKVGGELEVEGGLKASGPIKPLPPNNALDVISDVNVYGSVVFSKELVTKGDLIVDGNIKVKGKILGDISAPKAFAKNFNGPLKTSDSRDQTIKIKYRGGLLQLIASGTAMGATAGQIFLDIHINDNKFLYNLSAWAYEPSKHVSFSQVTYYFDRDSVKKKFNVDVNEELRFRIAHGGNTFSNEHDDFLINLMEFPFELPGKLYP